MNLIIPLTFMTLSFLMIPIVMSYFNMYKTKLYPCYVATTIYMHLTSMITATTFMYSE